MMKQKQRILIVDDSDVDRHLLEEIIKKYYNNFSITTVSSGEKALKEIKSDDVPDLVILDIYLVDESGFDILQEIKNHHHDAIPVLLMSTFSNEKDKRKGLDLGVMDFIDKPIVPEDVRARIDTQLRFKKILDNAKWASEKTNEGIRLLYKELEKKNDKLRELDQMKNDFVGTVSHELRTPMTIIRESISQINDGLHGPVTDGQIKYLLRSVKNIDRLCHIIENLLDMSKLEQGQLDLLKESTNIVELAQEVCANFESKMRDKGLDFQCEFVSKDIEAFVDRERLFQVFTNFLGNALKFTQQGYVRVSVKENHDHIACSVEDSGKGIAKQDLSKLFDKFVQLGREHGPGERGTGLGLSICKGIIELHQGEIFIESELTKGTTFTFTLPKTTARDILVKSIEDCLKNAQDQKNDFAILTFGVENAMAIEKNMNNEDRAVLYKELENCIKQTLHRKLDKVIRDTNLIYVILPETKKKDARVVIKRISQVIDGNRWRRGLKDVEKFLCQIMAYPDDDTTLDGFLKKVILSQEAVCSAFE